MTKAKTKESTSTEVAVVSPEEQAYLDSLSSGGGSDANNGPARLVINTVSKDKDGVKRPIGAWHIQGTDKYFDGEISFRPVRFAYKLMRYQETDGNWKLLGQSVYFSDFSEEILDSLGGVALGRKFGSAYSQEEKDATKKQGETYLDVFGFVTFGDEEPYPVCLRVRGGKLFKMLNAFKALPKDKRYSQYAYKLETMQPEGKTYWDMTVTPDMSQVLPITPILKFDSAVLDFIRDSNSQVLNSHKKNRAKGVEASFESSQRSKTAALDDDEIPF